MDEYNEEETVKQALENVETMNSALDQIEDMATEEAFGYIDAVSLEAMSMMLDSCRTGMIQMAGGEENITGKTDVDVAFQQLLARIQRISDIIKTVRMKLDL